MREHLTKFVTLILTGIISSCGSLPQQLPRKPSIDSCVIIWDEQVGFCVNNQTRQAYDIPLVDMNKYSCFSNEHYGLILEYVKELELRTPQAVKEELRKIRASKKKLNEHLIQKGLM